MTADQSRSVEPSGFTPDEIETMARYIGVPISQRGRLIALAEYIQTLPRRAEVAAQALSAPPDEGLREMQAALPSGYALMVGYTRECRFCDGWWATASARDPIRVISSETGRPRGEHHDATPAQAIAELRRALAANERQTDA